MISSVFLVLWYEFSQENVKVLTIIPSYEGRIFAVFERLKGMIMTSYWDYDVKDYFLEESYKGQKKILFHLFMFSEPAVL